jgi:hypothetical protein
MKRRLKILKLLRHIIKSTKRGIKTSRQPREKLKSMEKNIRISQLLRHTFTSTK